MDIYRRMEAKSQEMNSFLPDLSDKLTCETQEDLSDKEEDVDEEEVEEEELPEVPEVKERKWRRTNINTKGAERPSSH